MINASQFSIYSAIRPAEATLAAQGLEAAWQIYLTPDTTGGREEATIRSIVWKLEQYGAISDAQVNYLRSLTQRIAARAIEQATAADCPAGRMEISGEVISCKLVESQYGTVHKILLRDVTGWKVWGTVPRALDLPAKGDTVTLTATIEPSKDDRKFGFYSRPTGATLTRKLEVA